MIKNKFLLIYPIVLLGVMLFLGKETIGQKPGRVCQLDSLHYVHFLELKSHKGGHLYTGENLQEILEKGYWSMDLRYGWQTTGKTYWDGLYRYPRYGVGLYYADLKSPHILGNPSAIYGFINIPFYQRKKWSINYDISLGVSYDFEQYDEETNPMNDAIGSDVNVYVSFGFQGQYALGRQLDLLFGVDYTHFSNGRTTTPNSGLNLVGTTIGLRYNYRPVELALARRLLRWEKHEHRPRFPAQLPEFSSRWEWDVFAGGGRCATYATDERDPKRYTSVSLSVDRLRRYSYKYSYGVGLDFFYDGSLAKYYPEYPEGELPLDKRLMAGVHLAHNWYFYDFALMTQLATYLYKDTPARGKYYARVGIQYNVSDHWFGQISLKTQNGTKADFIEWGFGSRIF